MTGVQTCALPDRKSTRLNSSHTIISYAVFCLKKNHTPAEGLPTPAPAAARTDEAAARAPKRQNGNCDGGLEGHEGEGESAEAPDVFFLKARAPPDIPTLPPQNLSG